MLRPTSELLQHLSNGAAFRFPRTPEINPGGSGKVSPVAELCEAVQLFRSAMQKLP